MPRIGPAYQLRPTTILRAGYGIFHDSIGINGYNSIQTGFSTTTPAQVSLDSGLTYIASTADPFPSGLIKPPGAAGGLSTNLGQSLTLYGRDRKNPDNQRWSFGVQHLLPGKLKAEVTYVGNRGTRVQVARSMNALPLRYLSKSLVRDTTTINYLSQTFANPFHGANSIYGKNISRSRLPVPYPQFGGITLYEPTGYSWYHALQAGVERRFSKGFMFMFMFSYTFSRSMDAAAFLNAGDTRPYESLSTNDRPHRVVISGIWELPFGRKRQFGSNMPSALNFAAGFNRVGTQQLANNVRYSPWRFGNLRADGQARQDFSIFQNFLIREKVTAQCRAEVVSAWNHPNLLLPDMTPTSRTFGMITTEDATRT